MTTGERTQAESDDIRIAARFLRSSSWPGDMAEEMEQRSHRLDKIAEKLAARASSAPAPSDALRIEPGETWDEAVEREEERTGREALTDLELAYLVSGRIRTMNWTTAEGIEDLGTGIDTLLAEIEAREMRVRAAVPAPTPDALDAENFWKWRYAAMKTERDEARRALAAYDTGKANG